MLKQDLQSLFERDLNTLIENIEATSETDLWRAPKGVTNSVGVLAQHLVGNLNHFIGKGIGKNGYVRQRDVEFTNTNRTREELIRDIEALRDTINTVFEKVDTKYFDEEFPLKIPFEMETGKMLIHLYGHLNYHLGQLNYLRRILSKSG